MLQKSDQMQTTVEEINSNFNKHKQVMFAVPSALGKCQAAGSVLSFHLQVMSGRSKICNSSETHSHQFPPKYSQESGHSAHSPCNRGLAHFSEKRKKLYKGLTRMTISTTGLMFLNGE